MIRTAPRHPWLPDESRMAVRGRLVVRLKEDAAPPAIPSHQDVVRGLGVPTAGVDGGRVDAVLRRYSPAVRVTRCFSARNAPLRFGRRRHIWDAIEVQTGMSRTLRVQVDPDTPLLPLIESLWELEAVEEVTPHYLCLTPFEAQRANASADGMAADLGWAHRMIRSAEALQHEPGDRALIVAVVDSGVELRHPELDGRLRPGIDTVDLEQEFVARGMKLFGDVAGRDRQPDDEMGHGTAVASIIGARGGRLPLGVAGPVPLLPIRVLASARMTNEGTLTAVGAVPDIDAGVKTAVDLGARVLNLSFGTPGSALREDDPRPHEDVIRYAQARGCVLVAASGNAGDDVPYYPAALDGVIAVGSVGRTGTPSHFSSRGSHVALCAPGEGIPSAALGASIKAQTGTSFAAPFVTAACALLLARANRMSVPVDAQDLRAALVAGARPFEGGQKHIGHGAGILDVPGALRALEERLLELEPALAADTVTPAAMGAH